MNTKKTVLRIVFFVFLFLFISSNAKADSLSNRYFAKSRALIRTSLGFIKLKNYNKAERALDSGYKMAQRLEELFSRNIILNEIADKYILLERYEKAFKVAREIEFSDIRSVVFSKIAYHYVERGDYQKTISLTKQIKDRLLKAMLLYRIVNKLNELELYDESMEILANTMDSSYLIEKLVVVQRLEKRMLKRNRKISYTKEEMASSYSPKEKYSKARHLILTAKRYFALGLYLPAKELLFKASLITEKITDKNQRNFLEEEIRNLSSRLYDFQRALISDILKKNFSK